MTKPFVFIDRGYFYVKCNDHDSQAERDGDRVGIASHVAAMNTAAIHYHIRHHRKRTP